MKQVDVLCVDDNADFRLFMGRAFAKLPEEVSYHFEENGSAALTALTGDTGLRCVPRIILLDLNMPGLSGFDVLREIRSHASWRHIPIIVLSSSTSGKDIEQAQMLGANAYMTKPSTMSELRSALESTCRFWLKYHLHPTRWN
ncbi:MAG: response regulator [Flavobacteriales bacterium]